MLKKIKKFFYKIFYALPYGLKGADSEIFGQKDTSNGNNIVIQQQIKNNNLGEALLQGEVTQEVEELRYSTYKAAKEANNYNYLGEGIAIKKKNINKPIILTFKNSVICESVGHELNRLDDYSTDRYTLNVKYKDIPRFKLEKYCNNVKVDLKNKNIILYFEKNTKEPELRMFFNELKKVLNGIRSEIKEYPTEFSFITNDTFTKYSLKKIVYESLLEEEYQYVLSYSFKKYEEDDILNHYYSESKEKKYQEKQKKVTTVSIGDAQRKSYCSMCGKEINNYDSDITTKSFGYPLCQECLQKINDIKKEIFNK